ncbi:MAG: hypothetical protein QOJ52_3340 [Acidimicrobiaceae bacterium]|nr:hypothetical protein [Acidimicrobiaceae bacterium]MDQ1441676.1 hypothetical protein [Acidimicrobiaceae bacterium]
MNTSTTPIVKRLLVAATVASVAAAGALVALRPAGAASQRPAGAGASLQAPAARASAPPSSSASATGATRTTRTTAARPTTSPGPAPGPANPGADGSVLRLQQRLASLGYDVGNPDGRLGQRTSASVMAFQKVEGLPRTGTAGANLTAALATAIPPRPLVPGGEATRVEVDLSRQVLLFWENGRLARILPVSTGSGSRYCVAGSCQSAVTPKGVFHVGRKVPGVDPGPLGPLYYPMYFSGGVAIHGAPSVPTAPASHGCVRIPMYAAASFFDQVPSGTAVYVV